MSKPTEVDVTALPYWHLMRDDVLKIVKAGSNAPKGQAHDHSAAMLAGVILQHIAVFAAVVGTQEAETAFQQLLESAAPKADYPEDDDSRLEPTDASDPSAQWDNRRTTH